jgi:hypothetical protein
MKNKEKVIKLLDQIQEKCYIEDEKAKKMALLEGKGSKAVGSSWMVFHLEILRNLIEEN